MISAWLSRVPDVAETEATAPVVRLVCPAGGGCDAPPPTFLRFALVQAAGRRYRIATAADAPATSSVAAGW